MKCDKKTRRETRMQWDFCPGAKVDTKFSTLLWNQCQLNRKTFHIQELRDKCTWKLSIFNDAPRKIWPKFIVFFFSSKTDKPGSFLLYFLFCNHTRAMFIWDASLIRLLNWIHAFFFLTLHSSNCPPAPTQVYAQKYQQKPLIQSYRAALEMLCRLTFIPFSRPSVLHSLKDIILEINAYTAISLALNWGI